MTAEYSNLERTRLEKLERLRRQGIEPYPARASRTHTSQQAIRAYEVAEIAGEGGTVKATLVGR
ncbi:MAG TPA: lysine--tRNA ligase, partial [Dehalococcoidia bacterium]|nr:lysine--tRNA ligase [Dehalococcoidia bacterium]